MYKEVIDFLFGMMYCNTGGDSMATSKIAITIEQDTLTRLDLLVKAHIFANRSRAIQEAVAEKLKRIDKNRLERECAKLDPAFEQDLTEEGLLMEMKVWPEY